MPAPKKELLAKMAKMNFIAKKIQLPVGWRRQGDQYPDAFDARERMVRPNPPTTLFREATLNKYHVNTAKEIGQNFSDFIDLACKGISGGIEKWMKMATIAGTIINGPVCTIYPGCVLGPPLTPLILISAPPGRSQESKYISAIAKAFGTLWQIWHTGLCGTIMYPAFSAFPGPVAAPMSNVPVPIGMLKSAGESALSPKSLKGMMDANLGDPKALHASELFDSIAHAFNTIFQTFKMTTTVQNVLGTGAVPSFAPPVAPAGPVIGGTVLPKPGIFM